MHLLILALRNLLRTPRRTVLSTLAICVGVYYLVVGQAMIGGIEEGIVRAAEDGLTGHLLIRPAGYPDEGTDHPVDGRVSLPEGARVLLEARARAHAPRIVLAVTLRSGADAFPVRAIGFDPARDPEVFRRDTWKVEGRLPEEAGDGLLVGAGVASLLDLGPGDRVVIEVRGPDGAPSAREVAVSGVVSTSNHAIDQATVYMVRALAAELTSSPLPTHVGVRLDRREEAEALASELRGPLGAGLEVITWEDETRELLRMQRVRRRALDALVGVLMAMSALAIANTILMAAHERVREIGTLRAMGMSRGGVAALFLAEGTLMGLAAGLIGAVAGGATAWWLSEHPIDLSQMAGRTLGGSLQFSTWLYARFSLSMVVAPVLLSAAVAVAASVLPARAASRLAPADAVRAP